MDELVVEVTRGGRVESRHRVSLVVADAAGRARFAAGDAAMRVFPRSAVKAMQALPFVESGAPERYGLGIDALALACASHSGARRHVESATATLRAAGLDPSALECGASDPQDATEARALARFGVTASALHNNCSGKHAGFLCLACAQGWETDGYVKAGHPVQRAARDAIADVTGATLHDSGAGIDGCAIPTYAIPLLALARGFAKLGTGEGLAPKRAAAA
ncbi:MAG: asparaginase, partial [Hyphomicrobiales bacterium]|nr:asparaginase [Hyphomicrobiales bacterium]